MALILLIDNYDSFAYNLYQLIGSMTPDIVVVRNDSMTIEEIEALGPTHIVLSPGPGKPQDAGICIEVVKRLGHKIPILGVCLGHQVIYKAFGGVVSYSNQLMHGKASEVILDRECVLFRDLPEKIQVARYHSLAAIEETLPECLKISARTEEGDIMGVAHKTEFIYGVQFHPESVLTPDGKRIIQNFLEGGLL